MGKRTVDKQEPQPAPETYVVVNPISYGEPEVSHATGAEVSDIPSESVGWLLEQGHIQRKGGDS